MVKREEANQGAGFLQNCEIAYAKTCISHILDLQLWQILRDGLLLLGSFFVTFKGLCRNMREFTEWH